jgi:hypothetical protein
MQDPSSIKDHQVIERIYESLKGLERPATMATTPQYSVRIMTKVLAKELKDVSDTKLEPVGTVLPVYPIL